MQCMFQVAFFSLLQHFQLIEAAFSASFFLTVGNIFLQWLTINVIFLFGGLIFESQFAV